uniref:Uncharacterized protein n=1 Tax=Anguilla anguilla TaxID=7936 RepID=A0A0E9PQ48_ANGAN
MSPWNKLQALAFIVPVVHEWVSLKYHHLLRLLQKTRKGV